MSLRRLLAGALVAAALFVPSAALAGSGGSRPSTGEPSHDAIPSPTPPAGPTAAAAEPRTTPPTGVTPTTAATTTTVTVPRPAADIERLRLACEVVRADAEAPYVHRPGVACRWSASTMRSFAGYRLWRSDGEHREVVFRTRERSATRYLDVDVEPGGTYLYLVEAVDGRGHVIGRSEPTRVTVPKPPRAEELRLACEPIATDAGRGIGCRWSASQHPEAAGYLLFRAVDGGERALVHRGGLDVTRYLDTEVRPGHRYTYAVIVVDAEGDPLGSGGPVTVGLRP